MNLNQKIKIMKEYRYLLDKNIEINYTPNDTSMNYKDNINITSVNPINTNKDSNYFFPSYNTRQFNEGKNINSKITKKNSKYSTCYNYYPRKNYSKYLNYQQATNSSCINKNNNRQQNTTFDEYCGYNKLNTKDLIEITQKRKEIINQQKIFEQEKKKYLENNLDNLDIILNDDLNNTEEKNKNYCDEGVQTSLVNNTIQTSNKKEENPSTIIFTDKSALINQEITFLSIQYSINKNNKENSNNNSDISKDYKNTENNDFVNYDNKEKETINDSKHNEKSDSDNSYDNNKDKEQFEINLNKSEKNISIKNKKEQCEDLDKINDNYKNENDLEFTIVNNTQTSNQEENDDNNYMTNGMDTFKIELNEQKQDNKNNNNDDDNNFIISNNNTNILPKMFNDSLEDSTEINNKNNNEINKSKSLTNSEDNELTEVEEFDQNLIFLQNQSKTMKSHFDNINEKNSAEKEENKINNNNILIEDISNNNKSEEINLDSLNDSLSLKNKINNNDLNYNDNTKENIFRFQGRKNNSLNKYNNYPNLKNININDNNSLKSKIDIKNNLTNNERYQIKNLEDKENEYNELLKLKKSDLTTININNNNKLSLQKPFKNSDFDSKEYIYKPNISSYNKIGNNMQNIKVFSQKKLNITTNENNKINISGIPINPNPSKNIINNNINERNYFNNNNLNIKNMNSDFNRNQNLRNINNKNCLITPRCTKKKRHINKYAEYYKLKISMSRDISNTNSNNINSNINNNYDYNKNYRSIGHQKSNENLKKKK